MIRSVNGRLGRPIRLGLFVFSICLSLLFSTCSKAQPGPVPDKSGWTVETSGAQSEEHPPELAVDGDLGTRWSSPFADGHWLQIDLGQPATVCGVRLSWETARAAKYRLLCSVDAKNWQTCVNVAEGHGLVDQLYFPPADGRYWRIICDKRATQWGASLWEVDLLGRDLQPIITASATADTPAAVLLDGDLTTVWHGSTDPRQTIKIDLRQCFQLSGLCVYWGDSSAATTQLEASADGDTWRSFLNVSDGEDGQRALMLGPKQPVRFLRLVLSDLVKPKVPIAIRDIELRGSEEALRTGIVCHCDDAGFSSEPSTGFDLSAQGHDSRIDLRWKPIAGSKIQGYNVYRADFAEGLFEKLNSTPQQVHIYSDFLGENDRTCHYRVTLVNSEGEESKPSRSMSATSFRMTDEQLLTSVQEAVFRYFWDFTDPASGLTREGFVHSHPCETCTSGGTGFGMMTTMVGAERGFVSRDAAASRLLKMVRFLGDKAQRFHGAWSHWLHGVTGETIPFGNPADNGGDLVETAFLIQGMLTVRQYFDRDNVVENELRERITRLWEEVEWDWYLRESGNKRLYWHWSPDYQWKLSHQFVGFNECMITYLLAIASPTHGIPVECYYDGWVGDPEQYANGRTYYGHTLPVGPSAGPLFFTHYSFLGLDPHSVTDRFCNYFDNNRITTLINRAYCIENPGQHQGYGELLWGLTASQNPEGYKAHAPAVELDDGTVAPTAALSSMPYTPNESLATLRHLYHELGHRIWGPFGFYDAFNLDRDWVSPSYLAIDQGPIVPMIENYRTQLCWKMFMSNPEIEPMLKKLHAVNETMDSTSAD